MPGENAVPTLVRDKNGRLTTVYKGRDGSAGTARAAYSEKVRNAPTKVNPSVRDYIGGGAANRILDEIANLEDEIALKSVNGLINDVVSDFPDASRIVLEQNRHSGVFEVVGIENSYKEPMEYDAGDSDVYDLFAARVDVESSLVKETQYGDRYVIEWENG